MSISAVENEKTFCQYCRREMAADTLIKDQTCDICSSILAETPEAVIHPFFDFFSRVTGFVISEIQEHYFSLFENNEPGSLALGRQTGYTTVLIAYVLYRAINEQNRRIDYEICVANNKEEWRLRRLLISYMIQLTDEEKQKINYRFDPYGGFRCKFGHTPYSWDCISFVTRSELQRVNPRMRNEYPGFSDRLCMYRVFYDNYQGSINYRNDDGLFVRMAELRATEFRVNGRLRDLT